MELLLQAFSVGFMQRAMVVAVLLGALTGVVGVHVALRRLAFMADTYTHTVFPGMAVAFALGWSIVGGALVAGLLSAVAFTALDRSRRITSDAALAVLLTSFFAVGVIVISRTERYSADLTGLLFGRILTVDGPQLWEVASVLAVVGVVLVATHKELVFGAFDPEGARAAGYRVAVLDLVVNLLIVAAVVAAARSVGTVLTVALLITPAAAARAVSPSVGAMYWVAAAVGAAGGWLGLMVTYQASMLHDLRLPPGATMVLTTTALFGSVLAGRSVVRSFRRPRSVR